MRIALVTWERLPRLSDDDRQLLPALEQLESVGVPEVWSDPSVDWGGYDAVVVRSTWDYYRRYPEFLAWVERAGARGGLWNRPRVIRWNSHKSYLKDLEERGVPIVPTRICPDATAGLRAMDEEGWSKAVVKAAVSAGGYRTYRVDLATLGVEPAPWRDAPPEGEVLVQPYQPEVERSGERSLVFLGGSFSHAFLRAPRLAQGTALVEEAPLSATAEELAVARAALAAAPDETLYGRVDMVLGTDGAMRVMELELIEPALALASAPGAAATFARSIVARR